MIKGMASLSRTDHTVRTKAVRRSLGHSRLDLSVVLVEHSLHFPFKSLAHACVV
jgi:hypothetical protein